MKTIKLIITILLLATVLLSFQPDDEKQFEFSYPKRDKTKITLKAHNFKKFSKEWRGTDYYYYAEGKDGMICSVLYYKLNDDEKLTLVDAPKAAMNGPEINAAYAFAYFINYSNLKKYEDNNASWGQATDDFMFQQNDIRNFNGIKINQKHMYAYCMPDKDLFVNIHLSKVNCTAEDSTTMRQILMSLSKLK
ncbi:MAG TPA: hypothetical protein DGG95_02880 [Cytophagales bacterium]|jgi:hypothetical protein|nr:hypothetical protein [Cytophagales bacterium]